MDGSFGFPIIYFHQSGAPGLKQVTSRFAYHLDLCQHVI